MNAASGSAGALAPDTLASIYGTGLSYSERAISTDDIAANKLPVELPGTGVRVLVAGWLPAQMYYVSPNQVNFLVPSNLVASETTLQLVRDGTAGPAVRLRLREAAPALFKADGEHVLASHADFSLVTPEAPSRPGDWVVLWATGLGPVTPPATYGLIPLAAAWLQRIEDFQVLLDGEATPPERIGYAGVAPLYAGLYQINLKLPETTRQDPEVRIATGDEVSPAGLRLWVGP